MTDKHILVFNVGSSSIKYAVFNGTNKVHAGYLERITTSEQRHSAVSQVFSETQAFKIHCVAHRVVHGGDTKKECIVTPKILSHLKSIAHLAPIHDFPEIEVIEACQRTFNLKQVVVFDTAFHETIPTHASIYGLPYKYFLEGIRKYGFHGISHEYITRGLKGKVISCHLGNGCSISAIVNGKSIENSMGFTPLDGLVMGTRSGSIDPGIIDYLHTQKGMSLLQITHMLNRESGLLGLSGIGGDVRDLLASKKPRAKLALEVFVYRIISTVGSYITVMGGVDTIVFTGGIGQNSGQVRKMVCDYFGYIGLSLDSAANRKNALVISSAKSKINVRVVVADEERAIVEKTIKLIR